MAVLVDNPCLDLDDEITFDLTERRRDDFSKRPVLPIWAPVGGGEV